MTEEEKEQAEFEQQFDDETLAEPLHENDTEHIGELLMDLQLEVRLLFTRARHQYGGDTWISMELWAALQELNVVWERFQRMYDAEVFPGPNTGSHQ